MKWIRGEVIGQGGFATINRVILEKNDDHPMVVKTCGDFGSESLINEKSILDKIGHCPEIIRCYEYSKTFEEGEHLHNIFLEYASGGSLYDRVKKHGGPLPESQVQGYTKTILKGLCHMHSKGFVHCDIKLDNILVFESGIKIADFGLSIDVKEEISFKQLRGTPIYLAPETINENKYEMPMDIWALGCAVAEMVTGRTGKSVWNVSNTNVWNLILRIGGTELPEIPQQLSEEGKDFLEKCLDKDPKKRWTAEMLLSHTFISGIENGGCDNMSDDNDNAVSSEDMDWEGDFSISKEDMDWVGDFSILKASFLLLLLMFLETDCSLTYAGNLQLLQLLWKRFIFLISR